MWYIGPVDSYYSVVEAQGHGLLHCHFFIWLNNGLSPSEVKHKLETDPQWKGQLIEWLDDIISQDFPENTIPNTSPPDLPTTLL